MAVFSFRIPGASDPAVGGFNVTPSDSTVFSKPTRAIFVGGAGTITPVMADGTTPQFTVAANTWLYIRATGVKSTGTAATLIVGVY